MSDFFRTFFSSVAGPLFLVVGLFVMYKTFSLIGVKLSPVLSILIALSPIWLTLALFFTMHSKWMDYVRMKFLLFNGRTTLRIHLPQEVFKSPEAMESVMAQIHNVANPDNLMHTYLDGRHPLIYSFELVSIGGEVRFYVNVPTKKTKNAIEAQLYAQYPGIEVVEEELDYTDEIVWDTSKYEMISFHITKKEDQVFPIKTYIDFGLDKLPKEEQKFEPMASMIEQLGKAKSHERIWIQILCRPHAKKTFKTGYLKEKSTWEKSVQDKVNEILKRDTRVVVDKLENEKSPMLTIYEKEKIAAMERNVGKYAYETAIRVMYITQKGKFDGDILSPTLRTFAQYDILNRNGLGVRWRTDFDYNFFSDFTGKKKDKLKRVELIEYKLREYSTRDKRTRLDSPKVMSVEELATIFHIPGSSVVTPSLSRITSTRKEAPSNLPTGIVIGR